LFPFEIFLDDDDECLFHLCAVSPFRNRQKLTLDLAVREIQDETKRFKQYYALFMSFLAFGLLWGVGALVFMFSEQRLLGLSYFEALYFCFVSLLTIG